MQFIRLYEGVPNQSLKMPAMIQETQFTFIIPNNSSSSNS